VLTQIKYAVVDSLCALQATSPMLTLIEFAIIKVGTFCALQTISGVLLAGNSAGRHFFN
jgi:hypothetical protein